MKPLIALLAFALPLGGAPLPKDRRIPDYYPVAVGNEWVYEMDYGSTPKTLSVRISEVTRQNGTVIAKAVQTEDKEVKRCFIRIDENGISKNYRTGDDDEPWTFELPKKWVLI